MWPSMYTWDVHNTTNYSSLTPPTGQKPPILLCQLKKNVFSVPGFIQLNYNKAQTLSCAKPLLGVKRLYLTGDAAVISPQLKNALKMSKTNYKVGITIYIDQAGYATAMIFNFGKKYELFCLFQNRDLAMAYWND